MNTSSRDIDMSRKKFRHRKPSFAESRENEKWARQKLEAYGGVVQQTSPGTGTWHKYAEPDQLESDGSELLVGYCCNGGDHLVTHRILAGRGGIYRAMYPAGFRRHFLLMCVIQIRPERDPTTGKRWYGPVYDQETARTPPYMDYHGRMGYHNNAGYKGSMEYNGRGG